jgi:hypothetical protein
VPRKYQPRYLPDGTENPRYKKRKRPSGPSGKNLSKFARGKFVAWDGEGVTLADGKHIYAMLCTSAADEPSLINLRGLGTLDCLDMLCRVGQRERNAIHVAFVASYDVNMILADVSPAVLKSVWAGKWTIIGGQYIVCYRARKSFTVKRWERRKRGQPPLANRPGIVLWDVFGFFQSSFVEACSKYLGHDWPGLDEVRRQKARRSIFSTDEINDIHHYCKLECSLLVQLMERLRDYLDTAELPVRRWDGAGACAAALLQREGIQQHKALFPPDIRRAAQYAYAGGRMEVCRYGNIRDTPIYHYDINSAYPTAMCTVPSLAAGRWHHHKVRPAYRPEYPFSLYRISWDLSDGVMYPFFWRAYNCSIYFPASGHGWYWGPEVEAALVAQGQGIFRGRITVHEAYHWEPSDATVEPFEWLPKLYEQRKSWKREGVGAEKVIKLAINSLYGKCAQHLGGTADAPPRYHQLEWAGYITSYTRAMLYKAALPALHNKNIIMCATDALYSLEPLDVPTGDKLGQWEAHTHCGATVVQSGVYWTDDRHRDGSIISGSFCRGFDKGSLNRDNIIAAWANGQTHFEASLTRFVTMGSALAGKKSIAHWCRWRTVPRMLSLTSDGTKRVDELDPADWTRAHGPHTGLIHTRAALPAAQAAGQKMSAPYPLPWVPEPSVRPDDPTLDGVSLRVLEAEAYDTEA